MAAARSCRCPCVSQLPRVPSYVVMLLPSLPSLPRVAIAEATEGTKILQLLESGINFWKQDFGTFICSSPLFCHCHDLSVSLLHNLKVGLLFNLNHSLPQHPGRFQILSLLLPLRYLLLFPSLQSYLFSFSMTWALSFPSWTLPIKSLHAVVTDFNPSSPIFKAQQDSHPFNSSIIFNLILLPLPPCLLNDQTFINLFVAPVRPESFLHLVPVHRMTSPHSSIKPLPCPQLTSLLGPIYLILPSINKLLAYPENHLSITIFSAKNPHVLVKFSLW